jgi:4-amino-4-deoxy-L-arabinose transferase-like glycosyltransferase
MQRIKNTFKKKWVWALIVIVVFVVAYLIFRGGGKATGLEVQAVTKRDVSQIVSETGTVKASKDVNLSFLASGQVSSVHVVRASMRKWHSLINSKRGLLLWIKPPFKQLSLRRKQPSRKRSPIYKRPKAYKTCR